MMGSRSSERQRLAQKVPRRGRCRSTRILPLVSRLIACHPEHACCAWHLAPLLCCSAALALKFSICVLRSWHKPPGGAVVGLRDFRRRTVVSHIWRKISEISAPIESLLARRLETRRRPRTEYRTMSHDAFPRPWLFLAAYNSPREPCLLAHLSSLRQVSSQERSSLAIRPHHSPYGLAVDRGASTGHAGGLRQAGEGGEKGAQRRLRPGGRRRLWGFC